MANNIVKLKAKNKSEEIILSYLEQYASISLCERINSGNKTLSQCWNYIVSEAKKQALNGCACIEDNEVYGWAIHFFEEDEIKGADYEKKSASVKTVTKDTKPCEPYEEKSDPINTQIQKPKRAKKAPLIDAAQFSFDDMFG